jgi:hypothetical protein
MALHGPPKQRNCSTVASPPLRAGGRSWLWICPVGDWWLVGWLHAESIHPLLRHHSFGSLGGSFKSKSNRSEPTHFVT